MTALFYAALHYVEAHFFRHSGPNLPAHYDNHAHRRTGVLTRIGPLYNRYRSLLSHSRAARYDCVRFLETGVQRLGRETLEPLKTYVLQRL